MSLQLIHSFIQRILLEYLLCAVQCEVKSEHDMENKTQMVTNCDKCNKESRGKGREQSSGAGREVSKKAES